mgnify:CR=1 FL=1
MAVLEQLSIKMAKISEQRHLRAIRDGIVSTLPLIIVNIFNFSVPTFSKRMGNFSFSKKTCSTNATALPYDNVHNGSLCSYGNRLQPFKIV